MQFSSRLAGAALAVAMVALATPGALAQENRGAFRVFGSYMWPTEELDIDVDTDATDDVVVRETNEFESTWGVGIAWESRFSPALGLELGARYYRPELVIPGNGVFGIGGPRFEDEVSMLPVTAGLMIHLGSSENFDFYFGPQIAYIFYGEVNPPAPFVGDFEFDEEFTWGAKAAFDIPLGESAAFTLSAEYLRAEAELKVGTSSYKIDPRPVSLSAGVSFRY